MNVVMNIFIENWDNFKMIVFYICLDLLFIYLKQVYNFIDNFIKLFYL